MSWLTDVATGQQILSSWGNSIRNRIVQTFTDVSEMNSKIGVVPNGSIANLDAGGPTYRLYGGTWVPMQPLVVRAAGSGGAYLTNGQAAAIFSATIPPGYVMATHFVSLSINWIGAQGGYFQLRIYHGGGTFLVGQYEVRTYGTGLQTYLFTAANGCLQTGEATQVAITNITGTTGYDLSVNTNGYYTNYYMVLYPQGA